MKDKGLENAVNGSVANLLSMIQALKKEIENLEKENSELSGQIRELKNLISVL